MKKNVAARPGVGAGQGTGEVEAIVTHPYDHHAYRRRRWARRQLDDLLGVEEILAPIGAEIDYHTTHLDRGYREREWIGAELADAGWVP